MPRIPGSDTQEAQILDVSDVVSSTEQDAEAIDLPSYNWRRIRDLYPEKHSEYKITNRMYSYLLQLNNPKLTEDVLQGRRAMIPSASTGKYFYPNAKGNINKEATGRVKGRKLISTSIQKMLDLKIITKNKLTGLQEEMTVHEHLAAAIIAEGIKKGNFRMANIVLERTEGKVVEEINQNITMGLAESLKRIARADDEGTADLEDEGFDTLEAD